MTMSEDAVEKNIIAILAHSNQTRKELRAAEAEIVGLKNLVITQNGTIQVLQAQMGMLLVGANTGGATS